MCAEGTVLVSEDGAAESIQAEARERYERGPGPISEDEMTTRRYMLTDLLDDVRGCQDPAELAFLASDLMLAAGETALLASGRWVSRAGSPTSTRTSCPRCAPATRPSCVTPRPRQGWRGRSRSCSTGPAGR